MTTTHVHVSISLTPRRKRALFVLGLVASTGIIASAHADWSAANDPEMWATMGKSLSSAKFRDLFKEVDARLDALETTFCGVTISSYLGDQVEGYDGAADKCKAVSSCGPSARMCDATDLSRFAASGGTFSPDGYYWYTVGAWTLVQEGQLNDCNGWTSAAVMNLGPAWFKAPSTKPGGKPDYSQCSAAKQIACCN
ncbi:MAG: hypothetical protein U0414_19095 [Polyangiaceae bacterium]